MCDLPSICSSEIWSSVHNPMEIVLILGFLIPCTISSGATAWLCAWFNNNSWTFRFSRNNHVISCCFLVLCIYRYQQAYTKPLHDLFIYSSLPFGIFLDQLHWNNTSSTYWTLLWDRWSREMQTLCCLKDDSQHFHSTCWQGKVLWRTKSLACLQNGAAPNSCLQTLHLPFEWPPEQDRCEFTNVQEAAAYMISHVRCTCTRQYMIFQFSNKQCCFEENKSFKPLCK